MARDDDPFRGPDWQRWREHVLGEMVPMLVDSAVAMSLVPTSGQGDVKLWVELGAMIMHDKPIVLLASPDTLIPEHLRRVADDIIVCDIDTPEGQQEAQERIALVMERFAR